MHTILWKSQAPTALKKLAVLSRGPLTLPSSNNIRCAHLLKAQESLDYIMGKMMLWVLEVVGRGVLEDRGLPDGSYMGLGEIGDALEQKGAQNNLIDNQFLKGREVMYLP